MTATFAEPPPSSAYAGSAAARRAIELALPMLERWRADRDVCGSGFLHIVVLDPSLTPAHGRFDAAVLHEHSVGDRSKWDADYRAFALAKAKLAWTHGMDSDAVRASRPHLLRPGDVQLGGAVWFDGIVVGVSGAWPWWDEAVACCVAANLRAIAKGAASNALTRNEPFAAAPDTTR